MTERELIEKCKQKDPLAQQALYDKYCRRFKGVCLRYANYELEADDMLQDSFIKIFEKISTYNYSGSFEGWMRRIVVNTALDHIKRNKKYASDIDFEQVDFYRRVHSLIVEKMEAKELLKIIATIPQGYRTVFNLYAIEGYSHKEIAEMLGITESTSKSQYSRAKQYIQEILKKKNIIQAKAV